MTAKVKNLNQVLIEPTIDFAKEKIKEFNNKEHLNEKAINKVFDPNTLSNCSKEDIFVRVIVLDRIYSTRLNNYNTDKPNIMPSINEVAEKIYKFESKGLFELCKNTESVIELTENFLNEFENKSKPYSFITKYCSFRFPNISVPIQDSYVKGLLYYYNECERFKFRSSFSQNEIKHYSFFCKVFDDFVEKKVLCELSTKDIDKFLWIYAKEENEKGYNIQIF